MNTEETMNCHELEKRVSDPCEKGIEKWACKPGLCCHPDLTKAGGRGPMMRIPPARKTSVREEWDPPAEPDRPPPRPRAEPPLARAQEPRVRVKPGALEGPTYEVLYPDGTAGLLEEGPWLLPEQVTPAEVSFGWGREAGEIEVRQPVRLTLAPGESLEISGYLRRRPLDLTSEERLEPGPERTWWILDLRELPVEGDLVVHHAEARLAGAPLGRPEVLAPGQEDPQEDLGTAPLVPPGMLEEAALLDPFRGQDPVWDDPAGPRNEGLLPW